MNRSIIAGIHAATDGSIDPVLERFKSQSEEEKTAWASLLKLVEPLEYGLSNEILNCAAQHSAAAEVDAFKDGFRLATALIMETLGANADEGRGQP